MIPNHIIPLFVAGADGGIATDIGTCPGAKKGMLGGGAVGTAAAGAGAPLVFAVWSVPHFAQKRESPSN
jgi:hypothetical protein